MPDQPDTTHPDRAIRSTKAPAVLIIGGGLIGLHSAFFLNERGCSVVVADHGPIGGGASQGNAGFVCAGLVAPLAGPGLLTKAVRSLFQPAGALRVRPRAMPSLIPWFAHFARASTEKRFDVARERLANLNRLTESLITQLRAAGLDYTPSPDMVVPFHDPAFAERFLHELVPMRNFGAVIPDALLDGDELRRLVPALTQEVRAGFVLAGDRAVDPRHLVRTLRDVLQSRGVEFREHAPVTGADHADGRVRSVTLGSERVDADSVVLAPGAGLDHVARRFGLRFPVVTGQGYNVTVASTDALRHPVIFEEVSAVATPLRDRIRLGGTMEFTGPNATFDERRVDAVVRSLRRFLDLDWEHRIETWSGARPMSPDGLPLIGRPKRWTNLVVAGGHGMWGLTLGPSTGHAVADLVVDDAPNVSHFDPSRFTVRNLLR